MRRRIDGIYAEAVAKTVTAIAEHPQTAQRLSFGAVVGAFWIAALLLVGTVAPNRPVHAATNVMVSGNVYDDEASTVMAGCDGVTANIELSAAGVTYGPVSCNAGTGAFSIGSVTVDTGDPIVIWIDGATCGGDNVNGHCATTVIRYAGAGDITNAVLRRNQLIVRHDDAGPLTNADLATWDDSNDADVVYAVSGSAVTLEDQIKLRVSNGSSYAPGGNLTTSPASSAASLDGDVTIEAGATLTIPNGANLSIGGDYQNLGTLTQNTNTFAYFTATGSGFKLSGNLTGTSAFYRVDMTGGGSWTIADPMRVSAFNNTHTFDIESGTVTLGDGNGDNLEVDGDFNIGNSTNGANTGSFQTLALPHGQQIIVDINNNALPLSCNNCLVNVGTFAQGHGHLTINKNTLFRQNSGGIQNTNFGTVDILGSLDYSGNSTAGTNETLIADSTKSWSVGENTGKTVRITNGLAKGITYLVTATAATTITRASTESAPAVATVSGIDLARTVCSNTTTLITTNYQQTGRFVHDQTGSAGYLRVIGSKNNDANCSGNDSFMVEGYPDSLGILSTGDAFTLSDGVRPGDGYEILDYATLDDSHGNACGTPINYSPFTEAGITSVFNATLNIIYGKVCSGGFNGLNVGGATAPYDQGVLNINKSDIGGGNFILGVSGMNNTSVTNSQIHDSYGDAVSYQGTGGNNTFSGTRVYNTRGAGISSNNNIGDTFTGNYIYNNANGAAIFVGMSGTVITNNAFYNNAIPAFGSSNALVLFLFDANSNTMSGNSVFASVNNGITVYSSQTNTITNNRVMNSAGYGIQVGYQPTDNNINNTVTANTVFNNAIGIAAGYNANNTTISGNTVAQNTGYGILVFGGGENSTVSNNDVYDSDFTPFSSAGILIGADLVTVDTNLVHDNELGLILNGTSNVIVSNNQIYTNNHVGAQVYSTKNLAFSGNTIYGNALDGLSSSSNTNARFTNNTSRNNGANGFNLGYDHASVLTSNSAHDNALAGISAHNNQANLYSQNQLYANANGLEAQQESGAGISGNVIHDNSGSGISLTQGTSKTSLLGNQIYANLVGLLDAGDGTLVVNQSFGSPTPNTLDIDRKSGSGSDKVAHLFNSSFTTVQAGSGVKLAAGKSFAQVVAAEVECWNSGRLAIFYNDGTYSVTAPNFSASDGSIDAPTLHNYTVAAGKTPSMMIGATQDCWNNGKLSFFYDDGTYSSTNDDTWDGSADVSAPNLHAYTLAAGKTASQVKAVVDEDWNEGFLSFMYDDGTYSTSSVDTWDGTADINAPDMHTYSLMDGRSPSDLATIGQEDWDTGRGFAIYTNGSLSLSSGQWDSANDLDLTNDPNLGIGILSLKHGGVAGLSRAYGQVGPVGDEPETPQNESLLQFNYADALYGLNVSVHSYQGTGTEDNDLNFDVSTVTLSGGPYYYQAVATTAGNCASAVFTIYRNGTNVGTEACGALYTDSNAGVNLKFKIDGGGTAYVIGDAYSFVARAGSGDATIQKTLAFGQDGSVLTIPSGSTVSFLGQSTASPTVVTRAGSGGYQIDVRNGGTINANNYSMSYLGGSGQTGGLLLHPSCFCFESTIISLDNGSFDHYAVGKPSGSYIEVPSDIISTGTPSRIFTNVTFANTDSTATCNINATGSDAAGYWLFDGAHGAFAGESYDCNDGTSDPTPGQIAWNVTDPPVTPPPSGGGGSPPPTPGPVSSPSKPGTAAETPSVPVIANPTDGENLDAGDISVTGTADPGTLVELFNSGMATGTATADSSGNWSINLTLKDASYVLTARSCSSLTLCSSQSAPVNITVNPAAKSPLSATLGNYSYSIDQGNDVTLNLKLADGTSPYHVTVVWGDGSTTDLDLKGSATIKHTYNKVGSFSGTVLIDDAAGRQATLSYGVLVKPVSNGWYGALKAFLHRFTPTQGYVFPYLLFLLLVLLAGIMLWRARVEARELRILRAQLAHQTQLAQEKDNFVALGSHFLRTPLTLIKGGIELLGSLNIKGPISELTDAGVALGKKVELILAEVDANKALQAIATPNTEALPTAAWRSPLVVAPVLIVGVLTIVIDYLFIHVAAYSESTVSLLIQLVAFGVAAAFLTLMHRSWRIGQVNRRNAARQRAYSRELDNARNGFIRKVASSLGRDLNMIDGLLDQVTDQASAKNARTGLAQLTGMMFKFEMLAGLEDKELGAVQPVDVSALVRGVVTQHQGAATAKQISLEVDSNAGVISTDGNLLRYALGVVIDNAIKFSSPGSAVGISSANSGTHITVTDHGPGITSEALTQLFQPFSRGGSALDFSNDGLGFNLFLSKIIMHYLHGDVVLESSAGKGTVATLTL